MRRMIAAVRGRAGSNRRTASPDACEVMVGAARFELATPCSQSRCATRLRYAPKPRPRGQTGVYHAVAVVPRPKLRAPLWKEA